MPGTRRSLALCSVSVVLLAVGSRQPIASEGGASAAGDAERGYQVVIRQTSTCTLCHAGPFPNAFLQGTVGPDLHGVGGRRTAAEIRAQLVDASRFNPGTVMPSFGTIAGTRVGAAWAGKPILSERDIDDATAYLSSLK